MLVAYRGAVAKEGQGCFLKKAAKTFCLMACLKIIGLPRDATINSQRFFGSFFSKKNTFAS